MNFTNYLVNYTLDHIFRGNKSAYARAMEMDVSNFRRLLKSIQNEADRRTVIDQTLKLCIQSQIDISSVFHDYQVVVGHGGTHKSACAFEYIFKRAKAKCERCVAHADTDDKFIIMYQQMSELIQVMESEVCVKGDNGRPKCRYYHTLDQNADIDERGLYALPCQSLSDLIDALYNSMKIYGENGHGAGKEKQ